jgi:dihydrofolate reductase
MEGGEVGPSDDVVRETASNIGATIMGRNMFGGGPGPWSEQPWNGWWGDNPPFRTPVFVLTHHPREPLVMQGGSVFNFVTDGLGSALRQGLRPPDARTFASAVGARGHQYLAAGLVDEPSFTVPMIMAAASALGKPRWRSTADRVAPHGPDGGGHPPGYRVVK